MYMIICVYWLYWKSIMHPYTDYRHSHYVYCSVFHVIYIYGAKVSIWMLTPHHAYYRNPFTFRGHVCRSWCSFLWSRISSYMTLHQIFYGWPTKSMLCTAEKLLKVQIKQIFSVKIFLLIFLRFIYMNSVKPDYTV